MTTSKCGCTFKLKIWVPTQIFLIVTVNENFKVLAKLSSLGVTWIFLYLFWFSKRMFKCSDGSIVETQKLGLLQVVILINIFLWFAFGLVLQPVTFTIHLPETTLGNGFSICPTLIIFLAAIKIAGLSQTITLKHPPFSILFTVSFSLFFTLFRIESQWFHCFKGLLWRPT